MDVTKTTTTKQMQTTQPHCTQPRGKNFVPSSSMNLNAKAKMLT